MSVFPPTALDDPRRAAVLAQKDLNGLDYVEVENDRRTLRLTFLKPVVPDSLTPANILVTGGERPERLRVIAVQIADHVPRNVLRVTLQRSGDRSTYRVRLIADRDATRPPEGYDIVLGQSTFRFVTPRSAPDTAVDCEQPLLSQAEEPPRAEIDYLAKDYASFRRLMLERLSLLLPDWQESTAADEGVMLIELLAYVGDYLSYEQDAIATEAYLRTARLRTSVRRHARLVDYAVDEGANARTIVHIDVAQTAPSFKLAKGSVFLTAGPGLARRTESGADVWSLAALTGAEAFESMHEVTLRGTLAVALDVYTWGARDYSLQAGSTSATLVGHIDGLHPGDVLLVRAQSTDASEAYHPVRLTAIEHTNDPIGGLFADKPHRAPAALTEIHWHHDDALPATLIVAQTIASQDVAYRSKLLTLLANNVVVDHGLTLSDTLEIPPGRSSRPTLPRGPLVFARPFCDGSAAQALQPTGDAAAAIALTSASDAGPVVWNVRPDLLESDPLATEFVAEVEGDGTATLRFGDGEFGRRPEPGMTFAATYRVGGGVAGNIGEQTIASIVSDDERILRVWNPIPARGGTAPETLDHIRQNAPDGYRRPLRAVTAADYRALVNAHTDVLDAGAELRNAGGRQTAFVTVDRRAGIPVDALFARTIRDYLEPFRLIGVDIEVRGVRIVPLQVEVVIAVRPGYRKIDMRLAVQAALNDYFAPDDFLMGDPVYAFAIVAATTALAGVASAEVTRLQPMDRPSPTLPAGGQLQVGPHEKILVANDPRFPDRGSIHVRVHGAS